MGEMNSNILFLPVLLPGVLALFNLCLPKSTGRIREVVSLLGAGGILYLAFRLFALKEASLFFPWLGSGMDFEFRLYAFSRFILLGLSGFLFLIVLYSVVNMSDHARIR